MGSGVDLNEKKEYVSYSSTSIHKLIFNSFWDQNTIYYANFKKGHPRINLNSVDSII